jgi:hypothetical protein
VHRFGASRENGAQKKVNTMLPQAKLACRQASVQVHKL